MTELKSKVIILSNKKTCMRLANPEWEALDLICEKENIKRSAIIELIDKHKDKETSLTSSVRLFTLSYLHHHFKERLEPNYSNSKSKPTNAIFHAIKGIL